MMTRRSLLTIIFSGLILSPGLRLGSAGKDAPAKTSIYLGT